MPKKLTAEEQKELDEQILVFYRQLEQSQNMIRAAYEYNESLKREIINRVGVGYSVTKNDVTYLLRDVFENDDMTIFRSKAFSRFELLVDKD